MPPEPPPPNVAPVPEPPACPTLTCSTVPGVTASVPVTFAPSPPTAPGTGTLLMVPPTAVPPSAPYSVTVAEWIPAGTVHVWAPPVKVNAQVVSLPTVTQSPEAALAGP